MRASSSHTKVDAVLMFCEEPSHLCLSPPRTHHARQAHISCIAGACLAVGLRHAGSCSVAAAGLLRSRLEGLLRLKAAIPELKPDRQGWALGRVHVEEAVDVLALSLAIVMAGSGHSATLGLLRGEGCGEMRSKDSWVLKSKWVGLPCEPRACIIKRLVAAPAKQPSGGAGTLTLHINDVSSCCIALTRLMPAAWGS